MIVPSQAVKVLIATKPVDFRKGHDGLAAYVEKELGLKAHSGVVIVFRAKRADRIKILVWDGSGLVLTYKRLEGGKFAWPAISDGVMRLSKAQFEALFEGLDWRRVYGRRVRAPAAAEWIGLLFAHQWSAHWQYNPSMLPDRNDLDLNMLPPEHRAAFEAMQRRVDVLAEANKRQEALIKELRHALHGKTSETLTEDERQLAFEDLTIAIAECDAASEEARATLPASRKKSAPVNRNLGNLPEDLPRIEEIIEPDSLDCPCGCGQMHKIGEDRTERLDIIPAQLRVIVTIRPKYACRTCTDGVTQAPARPWLIESALPTEGTLAHVTVAKYEDHCPLYRQAQILARSGIHLDRSTLAGWVGKVAFHLGPIVDRLAENLKQSTKLFMDETTAPVLDPGRKKTKTGYLWALARDDRRWGGADPPGVVYFYAPGRGGEHAEEFLRGFDGILQIDGSSGYNRLARPDRKGGDPITVAHCRVDGVVAEPRPSQIRTCGFPASGSSWSSFAHARLHWCTIRVGGSG